MITEDTLASLRDNDERLDNLFVYLDDYSFGEDEDDITSLVQALRQNTRVTAVDFDMHVEEKLVAPMKDFMTGIGLLQNLQRLRCSSSGDYAVTMRALTLVLKANHDPSDHTVKSTKLTTLDLANFLLQEEEASATTVSSYWEFVDALRHHPTLHSFQLGFGFASSSPLPSPTNNKSSSSSEPSVQQQQAHHTLTPLLESVTTLPKLDWVRLDGAGFAPQQALTPEGLATLCSASTLSSVEIQDFYLSPDHVEAMARALGTNSNLKLLSLSCHKFHDTSSDNKKHQAAISQLTQALRTNAYLEELYLPLNILQAQASKKKASNKNNALMIELFQALEVNQTLQKLQITSEKKSRATKASSSASTAALHQAFRHMLQHNYGLQSIQISGGLLACPEEWEKEIQLHMRLNSMGRGRLVRNTNTTTRSQWMEVFGQVQDDVSCLFHLLLLNPLLCSSTAPIGQEAR